MKRNRYLLPGFIVVLLVGLFLYPKKDNLPVEDRQEEAPKAGVLQEHHEKSTESAKTKTTSISSREIEVLRKAFPDSETVRDEVAQNPHRTPRSLIEFALTLGPLIDKAKKNLEDASLLMNELGSCSQDETVANSARALCVSNAEKLSKIHSSLKENAEDIQMKASSDVRELVRKKNSLLKKRE